MTTVRVGTFDCENLFHRFRFKGEKATTYVPHASTELFDAERLAFESGGPRSRRRSKTGSPLRCGASATGMEPTDQPA